MGPSGVGKSSILASVAGMLDHVGTVSITGKPFQVYQDTDQLFPWMSVRRNLQLVSETQDWDEIARSWAVPGLLDRSPDQCSVGQRQRFALMRALYSDRQCLLCDEPLSGLDKSTAKDIIDCFVEHVRQSQKSVLWVTHDNNEANQLGEYLQISHANF